MKDFRKLEVWEKAHKLVLVIYKTTENHPKAELYGLTSQIRRAAVSIPTNIAEGCGRGSDADFARFLQIAMSSASELEYELLLSRDLGYLRLEIHLELERNVQSVKQMITAFMRTLQGKERMIAADQSSNSGKRTAERG